MKRSRPKTHWSLLIILIAAAALTYAGYKYFMLAPQSANIFLITPTSIEYGDTTITGTLTKDTAVGVEGNYLLILSDGRPVALVMDGLDGLVGVKVTVSGTLLPGINDVVPMNMTVTNIAVN